MPYIAEVQEVRNRLNEIIERLRHIQEEVRIRPNIDMDAPDQQVQEEPLSNDASESHSERRPPDEESPNE